MMGTAEPPTPTTLLTPPSDRMLSDGDGASSHNASSTDGTFPQIDHHGTDGGNIQRNLSEEPTETGSSPGRSAPIPIRLSSTDDNVLMSEGSLHRRPRFTSPSRRLLSSPPIHHSGAPISLNPSTSPYSTSPNKRPFRRLSRDTVPSFTGEQSQQRGTSPFSSPSSSVSNSTSTPHQQTSVSQYPRGYPQAGYLRHKASFHSDEMNEGEGEGSSGEGHSLIGSPGALSGSYSGMAQKGLDTTFWKRITVHQHPFFLQQQQLQGDSSPACHDSVVAFPRGDDVTDPEDSFGSNRDPETIMGILIAMIAERDNCLKKASEYGLELVHAHNVMEAERDLYKVQLEVASATIVDQGLLIAEKEVEAASLMMRSNRLSEQLRSTELKLIDVTKAASASAAASNASTPSMPSPSRASTQGTYPAEVSPSSFAPTSEARSLGVQDGGGRRRRSEKKVAPATSASSAAPPPHRRSTVKSTTSVKTISDTSSIHMDKGVDNLMPRSTSMASLSSLMPDPIYAPRAWDDQESTGASGVSLAQIMSRSSGGPGQIDMESDASSMSGVPLTRGSDDPSSSSAYATDAGPGPVRASSESNLSRHLVGADVISPLPSPRRPKSLRLHHHISSPALSTPGQGPSSITPLSSNSYAGTPGQNVPWNDNAASESMIKTLKESEYHLKKRVKRLSARLVEVENLLEASRREAALTAAVMSTSSSPFPSMAEDGKFVGGGLVSKEAKSGGKGERDADGTLLNLVRELTIANRKLEDEVADAKRMLEVAQSEVSHLNGALEEAQTDLLLFGSNPNGQFPHDEDCFENPLSPMSSAFIVASSSPVPLAPITLDAAPNMAGSPVGRFRSLEEDIYASQGKSKGIRERRSMGSLFGSASGEDGEKKTEDVGESLLGLGVSAPFTQQETGFAGLADGAAPEASNEARLNECDDTAKPVTNEIRADIIKPTSPSLARPKRRHPAHRRGHLAKQVPTSFHRLSRASSSSSLSRSVSSFGSSSSSEGDEYIDEVEVDEEESDGGSSRARRTRWRRRSGRREERKKSRRGDSLPSSTQIYLRTLHTLALSIHSRLGSADTVTMNRRLRRAFDLAELTRLSQSVIANISSDIQTLTARFPPPEPRSRPQPTTNDSAASSSKPEDASSDDAGSIVFPIVALVQGLLADIALLRSTLNDLSLAYYERLSQRASEEEKSLRAHTNAVASAPNPQGRSNSSSSSWLKPPATPSLFPFSSPKASTRSTSSGSLAVNISVPSEPPLVADSTPPPLLSAVGSKKLKFGGIVALHKSRSFGELTPAEPSRERKLEGEGNEEEITPGRPRTASASSFTGWPGWNTWTWSPKRDPISGETVGEDGPPVTATSPVTPSSSRIWSLPIDSFFPYTASTSSTSIPHPAPPLPSPTWKPSISFPNLFTHTSSSEAIDRPSTSTVVLHPHLPLPATARKKSSAAPPDTSLATASAVKARFSLGRTAGLVAIESVHDTGYGTTEPISDATPVASSSWSSVSVASSASLKAPKASRSRPPLHPGVWRKEEVSAAGVLGSWAKGGTVQVDQVWKWLAGYGGGVGGQVATAKGSVEKSGEGLGDDEVVGSGIGESVGAEGDC